MPAENIQDYKKMIKFHRALSDLPQKDELRKNFASSRLEEVSFSGAILIWHNVSFNPWIIPVPCSTQLLKIVKNCVEKNEFQGHMRNSFPEYIPP